MSTSNKTAPSLPAAGTVEQIADKLSEHYLKLRRQDGRPDPAMDHWRDRMRNFVLGRIALERAAEDPNFTVSGVSQFVRRWLAHPVTDQPATDGMLEVLLLDPVTGEWEG